MYGDGLHIRDWIHVEDHCRAIEQVLSLGRIGQVYNIGGGNELTNLKHTTMILEILGRFPGLIKFVADRPGHDRRYAIDAGKIRKELGWVPKCGFEEGLRHTVEWYCHNQNWVKKAITKG